MKKTILFCLLALTTPLVLASSASVETASIISDNFIKKVTQQDKVQWRADKGSIERFYQEFYKVHPKETFVWQVAGKPTEQFETLMAILKESHYKGLFAQNYHVEAMSELMVDGLSSVEHQQLLDVLMTDALLSYLRDISVGQPELIKIESSNWLLPRDKFDSVAALLKLIASSNVQSEVAGLEPKHEQYRLLLEGLKDFLDHADFTKAEIELKVGGKEELNNNNDRVAQLNNRLIELGYLDAAQKDQKLFDADTKRAVQAFQMAHLLEPDGVVGARTQQELNKTQKDRWSQLVANIERWRWMPKELGEHYLVVDIPSFEYYVMKDGVETIRAKTIVGMAQRSTPVFMAPMNHIVFAPYWNVPYSMAVKDKLPQLKRDPERLAKSKIRVLDRDGNEIDPAMVDWSQYNTKNFPYRLRQDPGSYNALGKVKFMFPNKHAIYLHDTPQKSLFSKTERTFSSGCIRIENPIELAEYFLKDQDWQIDGIKKAYNGSKERSVRLKEEMRFPVYTIYMTAAVDRDGKVVYRSDIYGKDPALQRAIAKLTGKL